MAENYRNLVIGSGEGGKFLAWTLARRGEKTVVVERSMIGGACPNIACLPSKNVIFSAKVASLVAPNGGLGVVSGPFAVDMPGVARRKREMVDGLREVHLNNFKTSGAELVLGEARFIAPKTVEVSLHDGGSRELQGDRVFLCLGSRAAIPNVPGLTDAQPMTHVEALELERLPEHLVVIGGGYVGLEFAQAMRRFSSRITIIQHGKQLLEREDPDVATAIADVLREEGVDILLEAELLNVSGRSGSGVELRVRHGGSEKTLSASDILIATGRTPNTDRIALDRAGVELDARRFIRVNDRLQTTAPDVWAMGDCAGSPQFTHVGYDDFRVVLSNLDGGSRSTRDRLIPYCLFTDPELAHVGLHETEAKSKGISYRIAKIPMKSVLRTRTISDTRGFAKALIAPDDQILGFTALGAEASEMLAAVQTAMLGRLPYTKLKDAIFTHPTAAEGLVVLFSSPLSDKN
ncbi:MAG TPA: mercuric reductase [Lacipirellulaceae bacterium]|nr:mercuric reductase [Lacipirellulaceae bacterium]